MEDDKNPFNESLSIKAQLKKANSDISYPDENYFSKKISAIKKNTTFVKKIKTFNDSTKENLIKEMDSLNLTRYIEEIATSIVECKLKLSDEIKMLEFCTSINQIYHDFPKFLLESFKKQFVYYKEEKMSNKVKMDLKLCLDLVIIGILPLNDGMRLIYSVVNHLINSDGDDFTNLAIIIHFLKLCGFELLGIVPTSLGMKSPDLGYEMPLSKDVNEKFFNLFRNYFENVVGKLKDLHKSMLFARDTNNRIILTKGEVSKEREERLTGYKDKFEKLNGLCVQMADLLNKTMTELQEIDLENAMNDPENAGLIVDDGNKSDEELFEDEETKCFYTSLYDLKSILPGILYKNLEKTEPKELEEEEPDQDIADLEKEVETEIDQETEQLVDDQTNEDQTLLDLSPTEESNSLVLTNTNLANKIKQPFDNYLIQLSNCINRETIDKLSQEFCEQYNTKHNRIRLAKELFNVSRNRLDLLPFYGRLVANINQITSDVGQEINKLLTNELKWHIKKRYQTNLESKIKTVRFIGELVKFGVFKKADALYCLRMLVHEFQHHNIDMSCALLESCGRYLYRSRASHLRTSAYLNVIRKKTEILVNDPRYSSMIDNAYYYCNPPTHDAALKYGLMAPLDPDYNLNNTEKFLRKLLYDELNKHSSDRVFKLVRKFPWTDSQFMQYAVRAFSEVWNVKYNNVAYLASVLAGLAPFHEDLVVSVVDNIIEEIRVGMDMNEPMHNQNRISIIRYLGNFYVYKLVNAGIIFNILYTIISYGTTISSSTAVQSSTTTTASTAPTTTPSVDLSTFNTQQDLEDSFFRINLIHTLLDTCGQYFKQGNVGRKLDVFFMYLQRYFLAKKAQEDLIIEALDSKFLGRNEDVNIGDTKEQENRKKNNKTPYQVLLENQLYDMIVSLRSKCKIFKSLEVCKEAILKFEVECLKKLKSKNINLDALIESSLNKEEETSGLNMIVEEDEGNDDKNSDSDDEEEEEDDDDEEEDTLGEEDSTEDEKKNENSSGLCAPKLIECVEDDEFLKMVDQVQVECMQNYAANKTSSSLMKSVVASGNLSIPIPMKIKSKTEALLQSNDDNVMTVPFSVITRSKTSNTKNNYTELQVPKNVSFVTRLISNAQQSERQRQQLNKKTLEMHKMQQAEEMMMQMDSMATGYRGTNINRYNNAYQPQVHVPHKGVPDINDMFKSVPNNRRK